MTALLVNRPAPDVVQLTMNRPDRRNAMDAALVQALHEALEDVAADASCRVVILTGTPPAFCAGLDLNGYGDAPGAAGHDPARTALINQRHISSLVTRITSLPQPVIAAVDGAAAGGGLALVLAADIRLSAPTGRFAAAFIRVGVSGCDIGTSWLLPRIVGVAHAQELMLTGRLFDAVDALAMGLVTAVADDVVAAALVKASEISAHGPFAVQLTKEAMWASLEIPSLRRAIDFEDRQQALGVLSTEHPQALAAFRAGRH